MGPRPNDAARNQREGRKGNLSSSTKNKELPNTRHYSLRMKSNFYNAGDVQGHFITDTLSCLQISHKQAAFWTLGLLGMPRRPAESYTGGYGFPFSRYFCYLSWSSISLSHLPPLHEEANSFLLAVNNLGRTLILCKCFTFSPNCGGS